MKKELFTLHKKYSSMIEVVGLSIDEVLEKSNLPIDLFKDDVIYMSIENNIKFMNTIKSLLKNKDDLLNISKLDDIQTFSPPIFASYCSENGLKCIERISKYKKLIGPLTFVVEEENEKVSIKLELDNYPNELPEVMVILEIIFLISIIRSALKENIIPLEITSKFDMNTEKYIEFFGINPVISNQNMIVFSKRDLLKPFLSHNDLMWEYFEPELLKRLNELEVEDTFSSSVRNILIESLGSSDFTTKYVASKIGVSKRTLQRKLQLENTTFQKQLNHTRELLARYYLKNTDMTLEDICYLLGYQDLNSFLRAFNIWTGKTISEYKKQNI
ncbi:MAG: helix-turn-helix domain-containing protein [Peptostreptococcaceae bacterium]